MEPHRARLLELARFGIVGGINSVFGYALFAGLIYLGLNRYAAQIVGQVVGPIFNYFMFRRHVFSSKKSNLAAYVGTYAVNYLVGLCLLFGISHLVRSAYVAGLLTLIAAAVINYIMLKWLVFRRDKVPA